MSELSKTIEIALNEVGYLEKKSNANLDDKTANAGDKNYTKYARDLDNVTDFYNGKKQNASWCCVFVDWCIYQATDKNVDRTRELLCYPKKSLGAGCSGSINYYKKYNQFFTSNPKVGDQIFFTIGHTGLVYKVDSTYVYTIEGNTSNSAEVIANGGCVAKKKYRLNNSAIKGYGRPDYKEDEEQAITKYTTATDGLNVRKGAGSNYGIVETLPYGTEVSVYETSGKWDRIGVDKWCYNDYLSIGKPVSFETKTVVNAKGGLNIRNKASIFGKKVGVLSNGAKVTVYSKKGSWSKISATEEKYVSSNYLK